MSAPWNPHTGDRGGLHSNQRVNLLCRTTPCLSHLAKASERVRHRVSRYHSKEAEAGRCGVWRYSSSDSVLFCIPSESRRNVYRLG